MTARPTAVAHLSGARGKGRACSLVCAFLLSGCASSAPPSTFNLSAPTGGYSVSRARASLVVVQPTATAPADGDRIVVRTGPRTIAYLHGAQWVEPLPALVQDRLIEAFENARLIRSVSRPSDNLNADFKLVTEIRRFDIDAATGEAVVEIAAKLASESNGAIVAGQIFDGRAVGSAQEGAPATQALNDALGQVLRQIVAWAAVKA